MSKLPHIQLLRAFAALCVAMFHAQSDAAALAARFGTGFARTEIFPWLAGVDIFFVISGFIMVYASSRWFGSAQAPRIFLAHRIARIVPLYWGATILFLAAALTAPALVNSEYLAPGFVISSFLFIPAARPDGLAQPLYSLGWTLNYEMFFYALFVVAIAVPRRRAVPSLIGTLILIVALGEAFAPLPQPLAFWSDPLILEFAFGMALGWASAEGFFFRAPLRLGLALAGLALLVLGATQPGQFPALPRPLAYGLPAAFIVASAGLASPARRDVESLLIKWGVILGDASYALYLLHPFVIRALREFITHTSIGGLIGPWGFVMLSLLCAAVAAVVVNRLFEHRVTRAARRLLEPAAANPSLGNLTHEHKIAQEPSAHSS